MSNSLTINDSSTKFVNGPKMSFSQTCNLLRQYVKEKRALGVTATEGFNRSTMNLFPVKQDDDSSVGRTINLFPQVSGFNSSANKRASPEPESAAPMTIFYGGKVVVFNDLTADKANEVMNLASSFESALKKRKAEAPANPLPLPVPAPTPTPVSNARTNIIKNPNQNPSQNSQNLVVGVPSFGNNVIPAAAAGPRATVRAPASDLPIARKTSLHRFLEKRKDRLVGKAPSSGNVADEGAKKPAEGKPWLGLNSLPIFQQQKQKL